MLAALNIYSHNICNIIQYNYHKQTNTQRLCACCSQCMLVYACARLSEVDYINGQLKMHGGSSQHVRVCTMYRTIRMPVCSSIISVNSLSCTRHGGGICGVSDLNGDVCVFRCFRWTRACVLHFRTQYVCLLEYFINMFTGGNMHYVLENKVALP